MNPILRSLLLFVGFGCLLVFAIRIEHRWDIEVKKAKCAALTTEGLEVETKWSDNFGCLLKRDGKWVRQ